MYTTKVCEVINKCQQDLFHLFPSYEVVSIGPHRSLCTVVKDALLRFVTFDEVNVFVSLLRRFHMVLSYVV